MEQALLLPKNSYGTEIIDTVPERRKPRSFETSLNRYADVRFTPQSNTVNAVANRLYVTSA
jgi:hypothetical protein